MVFFSKDIKSAKERVKKLSETDKYYIGKTPILSEKQIPHISGWKTWKLISKK